MKVLIVCSGNAPDFNFQIHQAFIYEQIETVKRYYHIDYDKFFIKGKGIRGYLKNLPSLKNKIKNYKPDIVHAHFGLSGLLANMQRSIPVILTLHGSDLNINEARKYSVIAKLLSKATIIVSEKMLIYVKKKNNDYIIPCGVDLEKFYPIAKNESRERLGWGKDKVYVLFSSRFDNEVKNFNLAKKSLELLDNLNIEIVELKNRSREEVNLLLNAVDLLLLTSFSEGSPQIIKEAMACNCPVVTTDVGDIKEMIGDTEGCYITSFDPKDVAEKIKLAIHFARTKGRTNGKAKIGKYDNHVIAKQIYEVYQRVLDENL
ncbi:glycosyl transferase group 1 [Melioribacter roseus P3M-2]|uniref:Glycosyl transferase group 1 n=1 Tax=Melioribacter roseus (strain DSM 23840 / JCM 17771 / VKM B-2668 / P3M-2) TaxID=1191523 RepID=I6ZV81_MELRP|nr:glycosyltransferase family 4 protein [Melioribacter roseus]AFN75909.1 glycosyl transferase group 1 [Melioribacter roseus P3M-2]